MTIKRSIKKIITLSLTGILLNACIKEDMDDCATFIHIDYTHNVLNSNAFGEQVDEVTLYVFDEKDILVHTVHDQGKHITNNYTIQLTDLPRGNYQFVAWAQNNEHTNEQANFTFPALTPGRSILNELTARLKVTPDTRLFNSNLNNLLVGHVPAQYVNQSTHNRITIPVKKITNTVRIVLIETGDKELSTDNYNIRIEELQGNGIINSMYEVMPDDKITYAPYYFEKKTARDGEYDKNNPAEQDKALAAEFALSRLIDGHNIRLIAENKEGDRQMDVDLLEIIKLAELEGNASKWSFQEYLDRQDHYSITFYVNNGKFTLMNATIIINGWVVNLVDIEM